MEKTRMTTILCDRETLAADRLVTGDGMKHGTACKIRLSADGDIIGLAGNPFDIDAFLAWYNGPRTDPPNVSDTTEILVLTTTGQILCFNHRGHSFEHDSPAAIGSGAALAYGAYAAGASPAQAVKIASERDIHSGGGVDAMVRCDPPPL